MIRTGSRKSPRDGRDDDARRAGAGSRAGRHVFVTGAANGIGRATTELLRARGARVTALDRSEAVRELSGDDVLGIVADARDGGAMAAAVAAAQERFGPIDGAVINVAVARFGELDAFDPRDFDATIEGTLLIAVVGLRAVLGGLGRSGREAIVITSSGGGLKGEIGRGAYGAAKAGVDGLVRAAAKELAGRGCRVNGVAPGPIKTAANAAARAVAGTEEAVARRTPLARWGAPSDVAQPIAFLLSPSSRALNGVVLPVDGGLVAASPLFPPLAREVV